MTLFIESNERSEVKRRQQDQRLQTEEGRKTTFTSKYRIFHSKPLNKSVLKASFKKVETNV